MERLGTRCNAGIPASLRILEQSALTEKVKTISPQLRFQRKRLHTARGVVS
jgi:hypothetical protein